MKLKIQTLGLRKYSRLWENNASHTVQIEPKNDCLQFGNRKLCARAFAINNNVALQTCSIASEDSCNHDW